METERSGKQYSREEIARNNGANGARVWIIVLGTVYDVTDYMTEHPGGAELLKEYAGGDATQGFEDFGHSSDAKKTLKKFEIGVVAASPDNEKSVKFESKDPKQKVKQRRKFLKVILGPCYSR